LFNLFNKTKNGFLKIKRVFLPPILKKEKVAE